MSLCIFCYNNGGDALLGLDERQLVQQTHIPSSSSSGTKPLQKIQDKSHCGHKKACHAISTLSGFEEEEETEHMDLNFTWEKHANVELGSGVTRFVEFFGLTTFNSSSSICQQVGF